jgi:orotidine-5'-phosphate decarboxylase
VPAFFCPEGAVSFIDKLARAWRDRDSLVCVGLDPELSRMPEPFRDAASIFEFNREIIDATHDLVCAYKPQIAHYAALSAEGQLERTIAYIKSRYPAIPVILDAKRGDIGSTAKMYADEAFLRYGADAVTVNPYLGFDAVEPFLRYADRGVILLCRTSNSGAADIQDLPVNGEPLYARVARCVVEQWNDNGNCLLVMGATGAAQISRVRDIVGDMPFLVPGVGAQGADVATAVAAGRTHDGKGLIVSSSRAILYAAGGDGFAAAARSAARMLKQTINRYRRAADAGTASV